MCEITKTISIPVDGNNQNVEAPVTINVTAVGSDPETVGRHGGAVSAADAAGIIKPGTALFLALN